MIYNNRQPLLDYLKDHYVIISRHNKYDRINHNTWLFLTQQSTFSNPEECALSFQEYGYDDDILFALHWGNIIFSEPELQEMIDYFKSVNRNFVKNIKKKTFSLAEFSDLVNSDHTFDN